MGVIFFWDERQEGRGEVGGQRSRRGREDWGSTIWEARGLEEEDMSREGRGWGGKRRQERGGAKKMPGGEERAGKNKQEQGKERRGGNKKKKH
jgi:hypothetical protein